MKSVSFRKATGLLLCIAMLMSVFTAGMTASAADLLAVDGSATYASAKKANVSITSIGGKDAYTMVAAEGDQTDKAASTTAENYGAMTGAKVVYSRILDYYGDKDIALVAYPSNSGKVDFKFPMTEGTQGVTIVAYDPWGNPISTGYIAITGEIPDPPPGGDEDVTKGITGVIQYKNPIKIQVNIDMEEISSISYAVICPGNQVEAGKTSTWDTRDSILTNAKVIFMWEDYYGKSCLLPFPTSSKLEFLVSAGSNPPEGFTIIGYNAYSKKVQAYTYIAITGEIPVIDPTAPDLGTNEYGIGVTDETLETWSHIKTNQVRSQTFSANNVNTLVNNLLSAEPARNKQKELYSEYYSSFKGGVSEYKYDELYLHDDYCQGLWDAFPATYGWMQDQYTEPGKWQKENYGVANMAYAISLGGQNPWVVCDYLERTAGVVGTAGEDWIAGYDEVACAAWLWHKETGTFLTYESRQSLDQRIKYIQDNDLGGIIVWEMSGDNTKTYPMTTKLNNGVKKQGGRVIGYFTNWAVYNDYHQKQSPNDLPWDKMTHINYSFFQIEDNKIASIDPWADFDEANGGGLNMFGELKSCKEDYPETSLMASVGGWTRGDKFHEMVSSQSSRTTFINSCIQFLKDYPYFDGIDLDWEYPAIDRDPDYDDCADRGCPGGADDTVNYAAFCKELRAALDKEFGAGVKELSACVPADPDKIDIQDLKTVAEACNFVNLMTYDYHGAFDPTPAIDPDSHLGYNSPLYRPAGDDLKGSETWNTKDSVDYCISLGIPKDKLNIGTPYYSRGWSGVPADENGYPQGLTDPTPDGSSVVDVTSVTVAPKTASVKVGESVSLTATVSPANATYSSVTWKSSDSSIATVDASGKVTGVKEGKVTITASADGKSDTAEITVTDTITPENNVIVMKFDATKAFVNDNVYDTTKYQNGYAKLMNVGGTAMMPLRYIAEVNGFDVAYDEATFKTKVTNKADGSYLMVTPGSTEVSKYAANGSLLGTTNAPSAFAMQDGVTVGPLRYTCEALGKSVHYQETSHGIYVVVSSQALNAGEADAWIEKAYGLGL